MPTAIENIFVIIDLLEFITGIWGNGFIILVICADWVKTKTISLFYFIFVCLAFSRISTICLLVHDNLVTVFCPEMYENHPIIVVIVTFLWNVSNSLSSWCATGLSVFYFLKLSNFSHRFFLWLKWRRDGVVFTILLGFFLSLFFNILSIKLDILGVSEYLKMDKNLTWNEYMYENQYFSHQILLNLGFLIPMVMSFISFFLLIFSLWKHTRQMTRHAKGSGDLNIEVHVRARNTMISFIILLFVHYTANLLTAWSYYRLNNSLNMIISETVALLYPSIHPIIMILGNRKLGQTSVNLLRQTESCFKGVKSLQRRGTEENC